jgi:hypothetical protein
MITASVDLKKLERDIFMAAAMFGEVNETGIARWGVGVARRLIVTTQVWGDGEKAKEKQKNAMMKDVNRAFVVVENPELVKRLKKKKLGGLHVKGVFYPFRPYQQIQTGDGVNLFIEANRKDPHKRVARLGPGMKCVTTAAAVKSAMVKRKNRIGKAKGGWVGAGQAIGAFQKRGSRLTIGKNFASYTHRHKSGGTASMRQDIWNPEGKMVNNVNYVSDSYVLESSDMQKAIIDGGRNTIKWYENALNGRLKKLKS